MSGGRGKTEEMLYRLLPKASTHQVESAGDRVLRRLLVEADQLPVPVSPRAPSPQNVRKTVGFAAAVFAASIVLAVLLVWTAMNHRIVPTKPVGVAGNAGASMLALPDGSHLELRAGSDVAIESAVDGIRLRLGGGSIIVTAAKQHGHLYVQTKDITVSVVGTVFVVNAEEVGSRVAVIEGSVQIQQGLKSKTLRRGEQAASDPSMPPVSMVEEVAWSSNAQSHLARLQQQVSAATVVREAAGKPLEFEVISVKAELPVSQDMTLNAEISGFSCHGTDGIGRSPLGQLPAAAGQGRCAGRYVSLPVLVGYAYDVYPRRVRGAPDWRPAGKPIDTGFQIEAKAEDASTATLADLKQMLKAALANRFKLEFRRDTTECSGYLLSVANAGLRISEARPEDESPVHRTPVNGREILKGKSSIANFANLLTESVGMPVADRTGLLGIYDIELTLNRIFVSPLAPADTGPRNAFARAPAANICGGDGPNVRLRGAQNQAGEIRDAIGYDPPVAKALEDQLGLRLEQAKVPVETIVIDHAERPTPN